MVSKAVIEVRPMGRSDPLEFDVSVHEPLGQSHHRVTLSMADHRRLSGGAAEPARCVEAAFRFLLDREPKEAILRRFDLWQIGQYFPEFEAQLPSYLTAIGAPASAQQPVHRRQER